MNKLLDRLNNNKMCLIASIPENNYEFAKAAWEAGVDAVKVFKCHNSFLINECKDR